MRYIGSRSFKVIKFGTNRTGICDFLSNFGYISLAFEITVTYHA